MKKKQGIGILLLSLMLCSFCIIPSVKGNYQVNTGEVYQYDVLKARINSTVNGNFEQGYGFTIDNKHLDENTAINYEITEINGLGVFWNLSGGGYSTTHLSEQTDIRERMYLTMFSFDLPWYFSGEQIENGSGLILYSPFIDVTSTSDHLSHLRTPEDYVSTQIESQTDAKLKYDMATFTVETDEILSIEFTFGGTVKGKWRMISVDATFSNHLIYDYNKSNGVLLGMKIKSSYNGVYDAINLERSIIFHIEYKDYDLAEFTLDDPSVKAGTFGEGLFILSGVFLAAFIFRKRNKN